MQRLILAALLLGLLLAPLETFGVLKKGTEQLSEVISSSEAQVLLTKVKAELPGLGARVSGFLNGLFPKLDLSVKKVQ
ncbi:hypothetical protein A2797_01950 [candidate division WWE3 bacterium RIFCSPHIGHO2_01_FULL_48_15]|uniref:Uncharacterized protein n=1 Tax=candidate division WWE3 bacterium RIFCSPHIGHO2_01_FULL_48_15 TaxID=1802619 RepID=A0A1F4VG92_UNCKA|nr:MAG: hypothetical protein A2797_01950 [candidate division WWE3 bacterium RIFCSPHIGHO2_01_FULL_48_15]